MSTTIYTHNKYKKWYDNIISNAKLQERIKGNGIYYEKHHIIPKCLGGLDELDNLVNLTAKEHFIVHHLLTKFSNDKGVRYAFWRMCNGKGYRNMRDYKITSIIYENCRIKFSKLMSGENNPMFGIPKGEHPLCGRKFTKEEIEKISGKNNGMYGKKHQKTSIKIMSEKKKIHHLQNPNNQRGENHRLFKGWFITPNGKYDSVLTASKFINIYYGTISKYCKNNKTIINKAMTIHNKYLQPEHIGLTLKEVGFDFLPKEQK